MDMAHISGLVAAGVLDDPFRTGPFLRADCPVKGGGASMTPPSIPTPQGSLGFSGRGSSTIPSGQREREREGASLKDLSGG